MTETTNNVILLFPNKTIEPTSIEDVIDSTNNIRLLHIQETISTLVPMIMDLLYVGGFNFQFNETNKCVKETALLAETIKALLMKQYDMEHPLHETADSFFEEVGQGIVHYKSTDQLINVVGEETETI